MAVPTVQGGIVVSWCGMRGIVTLAAAFALPESFPNRDIILFAAFAVVLGTLVVQGLTLRPLILSLGLKDEEDPVAVEAARARAIAYRAALEEIDGDPSEEAELLRIEYRGLLLQAENDPSGGLAFSLPADPLRRRAIAAARRSILQMRDAEEIGDDAFHLLEEEFDRRELSAQG